jgi:translation initiation factor 3 subunit I
VDGKESRTGLLWSAVCNLSVHVQVALVGGQEAANVTTTADAAGGFETRFFHKLYEEEFGLVRGHFGPVNSVAISPDGKSFTTGGEDGFVRLQHFDMDYLTTNFFIEA